MPCPFFACVKGVLGTFARHYREALHSKFSTPLGANHVKNDEGGVFSLHFFYLQVVRIFPMSSTCIFFLNFSRGF